MIYKISENYNHKVMAGQNKDHLFLDDLKRLLSLHRDEEALKILDIG